MMDHNGKNGEIKFGVAQKKSDLGVQFALIVKFLWP